MTPQRDEKIMEVFLAAVDLTDDRRAGFLSKVCGNDHELRREVESLLKHHVPETSVADHPDETCRSQTSTGASLIRSGLLSRLPRPKFGFIGFVLTVCFAALWYVSHQAVQAKLRQNVESQLQTVLNADVAAIEIWLAKQTQMAETWASQSGVRATLSELSRRSSQQKLTTAELESTDTHAEFLRVIGPLLAQPEIVFVGVFSSDGHGIAKCPHPAVLDVHWSSQGAALISPCFRGETVFMPTFRRGSNVIGNEHGPSASAAVSVVAPIENEHGEVIAAMQLVMGIDKEFATLFSMARIGQTGDSYAFDQRGVVLSELRFEPELRRHGLIPKNSGAALSLHLRDPGVDLRAHSGPVDQRSTQPICRVPSLAIEKGVAVDSVGYRNYLGVNVVGAAKWLPDYSFGVVTEIERDEAFAPLRSLGKVFGAVSGSFAAAAILAAILWVKNSLLRKEISEARKLGPYTLQEMIGQGGMAKVYRATHAVLRRPTAIKLIERRDASDAMVDQFEREAQLASELTHPSTIQIYDYGRTKNGVFYYAMELLPGISLAELIVREGPLPPARVIHLLRQICASLAEAHHKGMIHRDIKPANVMLCELGGQHDVAKVLDFGLVKTISPNDLEAVANQSLIGTPLYIAPERIRRSEPVDGRSDIYSVGTVAFFLLTGELLFDGENSTEVLYAVVNDVPRHAADVSPMEVPPQLDQLIDSCLKKDPECRPASMDCVIEMLDALAQKTPWTQRDARVATSVTTGSAFQNASRS